MPTEYVRQRPGREEKDCRHVVQPPSPTWPRRKIEGEGQAEGEGRRNREAFEEREARGVVRREMRVGRDSPQYGWWKKRWMTELNNESQRRAERTKKARSARFASDGLRAEE
jgi:hypothetical protein